MFQTAEHYLSFGSTDQATMRALQGQYDGLLVPGTVAALQREGTGGFLLALSAAKARTPYAIDPRTPLFQQRLHAPKPSFVALAEILADPDAVCVDRDPNPADFNDERIARWADGWIRFNTGYVDAAGAKFEKYARRLNQDVPRSGAQGPELVLAPYFVARDDEWWRVSSRIFEAVAARVKSTPVIRVVATESIGALDARLAEVDDDKVAVWVSGLDELVADPIHLAHYGQIVRERSAASKKIFALYGGYFAVVLCGLGMAGVSHGIGYGEVRSWIELPRSGPPPARFYLPRAHRYVGPELAQRLYSVESDLVRCECRACAGRPPLMLNYHELMQHSVLCRAQEHVATQGRPLADLARELEQFRDDLLDAVRHHIVAGTPVGTRLIGLVDHVPRWSEALRALE